MAWPHHIRGKIARRYTFVTMAFAATLLCACGEYESMTATPEYDKARQDDGTLKVASSHPCEVARFSTTPAQITDESDPDRRSRNPLEAFAALPAACLGPLGSVMQDITACAAQAGIAPVSFLPIRRYKSATPDHILARKMADGTVALVSLWLPPDMTDPPHNGDIHFFETAPTGGVTRYTRLTVEECPKSTLDAVAEVTWNQADGTR